MTPTSSTSGPSQTTSISTQTGSVVTPSPPTILNTTTSQQPPGFQSIPFTTLLSPSTIAAPPVAPVVTTSRSALSSRALTPRSNPGQGGGDRNPQPDAGLFPSFAFTHPPFIRDLLFNNTQWREADSALLTQRFVNELSESVAWEAVVKYANQYLIDLPAGLRMSQVAVLQVLQIFLQCELRLCVHAVLPLLRGPRGVNGLYADHSGAFGICSGAAGSAWRDRWFQYMPCARSSRYNRDSLQPRPVTT